MVKVGLRSMRPNFNIVFLDDYVLYFSYETLVAVSGFFNNEFKRVRTEVHYSNTTERHMNQANVKHWEEISQEELEKLISELK